MKGIVMLRQINFTVNKFKLKYIITFVLLLLIHITIAMKFSITNDEAYYIAFAKNLQLSYIDCPPLVSYLVWIPVHFNWNNPLYLRIVVILLHCLSSILIALVAKNNSDCQQEENMWFTIYGAYIIPIFGMFGIMILPDAGLIFSLSLMLYVVDRAYNRQKLDYIDAFWLGIGLGIGMLSKFHIFPLGIGMLLGLFLHLVSGWCIDLRKIILLTVIIIGSSLVISAPMWIWNIHNNFASFRFQIQHGFAEANSINLIFFFGFLIASVAYLTPWFTYFLIRYGFCQKIRLYLIIPTNILFLILLSASLKKVVLGHWIGPGFWLLLPYAVTNMLHLGKINLLRLSYYITTSIIAILAILLLLPGNMTNLKRVIKIFSKDMSNVADIFLWNDLNIILQDDRVKNSINKLENDSKSAIHCSFQLPLIATSDWWVTAQLEYLNLPIFDNKKFKIININPQHTSFYLWREKMEEFHDCPLLLITTRGLPDFLPDLLMLPYQKKSPLPEQQLQEQVIQNITDYKNVKIHLVNAVFRDQSTLHTIYNNSIMHPHF